MEDYDYLSSQEKRISHYSWHELYTDKDFENLAHSVFNSSFCYFILICNSTIRTRERTC